MKPAAIVDYGAFVYYGHFDIPLAGAPSRARKARMLLRARNTPGALAEAQQAEALAPESVSVNQMLGQVLEASGQPDDAAQYYQKAPAIAKTVRPELHADRIAELETRLAAIGKR